MMAALQKQQEEVSNLICEPRNTVVVTGFGPFQSHSINASWEAVRLLHTTGIEKELNICLVIEEIPVSYTYVEKKVPQLWSDHKPLLVVHVGVSQYAQKITLEQSAQKIGYGKTDIHGLTPPCNECCIGSSSLMCSALDIAQLSNEINSTCEVVETTLSEDAGRYLCEYIYYMSLSIDNSRCIFIHVPPLDKPYSAEQLARGLADIIRCLVHQLRKQASQQVAEL